MRAKHFLLFSILLLCFSCSADSFRIYAIVSNLEDQMIYIEYLTPSGDDASDSTLSINGHFFFKGEISEPTGAYVKTKNREIADGLFFGSGNTFLFADAKVSGRILSGGNAAANDRNDLHLSIFSLTTATDDIQALLKTEEVKLDTSRRNRVLKTLAANQSARDSAIDVWIAEHPSSFMTPYLIYFQYSQPDKAQQGDSMIRLLSADVRQSGFAKRHQQRTLALKNVVIGKMHPVFEQPDSNGKNISTTTFKGKYLLLDFWAAWCGPCRAENPKVVAAYNKYHDKGLEILGVSLDGDRDAWVAAIRKDSLAWPNVSDLKGWKNKAAQMYAINAVPTNYLLDKEGVIIAKNLRGKELTDKLEELLSQ